MEKDDNVVMPISKAQFRVFAGLAMQRDELQKLFSELVEAERQYIAMLVHENGLTGDYTVKQEGNEIYLVPVDSKNS